MGHGDYLEIANMQVLKISDDDFMIVVIIFISAKIMILLMITILKIVASNIGPPILLY